MKFKYTFSGLEIKHNSTIKKWLTQTFGRNDFIKGFSSGLRLVEGSWKVQRYWPTEEHTVTGCMMRERKETRYILDASPRLQVFFKKEEHLTLFILKFGHLMRMN